MSPYADQAILGIDLAALQDNYTRIQAIAPNSALAAVIKADAYGLGATAVSLALYDSGCRAFFVATTAEAMQLLPSLKQRGDDFHLACFAGLMPDQANMYDCPQLYPVLNTPEQVQQWRTWRKLQQAYIHLDTGMNRLGLRPEQWLEVQASIDFPVQAIISHLVDAENIQANSPIEQLNIMLKIQGYKLSLANSAGSLLDAKFALDQRRVGLALYGIAQGLDFALKPVVTLEAPILQQRDVYAGESVGYGHHYRATQDHTVLTIGIGYRDGIPRAVTQQNKASPTPLNAYCGAHALPLIGRVSMDTMAAMVSAQQRRRVLDFSHVSLLNTLQGIDTLAKASGTIAHETLTRLGSRLHRHYCY